MRTKEYSTGSARTNNEQGGGEIFCPTSAGQLTNNSWLIIQFYFVFTDQKLTNSTQWQIQNVSRIFSCFVVGRAEAYSKHCQTLSKFRENSRWFSAVNYFHKMLRLRCLTGFWILLWGGKLLSAAKIAYFKWTVQHLLWEKCLETEFFLVRISLYSDQKKLRIWTLFTQWRINY